VTRTLTLLPFMLLLFILPFPGTVALRLVCLAAAFLVAIALWRRLAPPPVPCKPALLAWAAVALLSLAWAVDPAYSLGEIKNEILYTMMAFVSFFAVTRREGDMRKLLVALFTGALVICVLALESRLRLGAWMDAGIYGGVASFVSYAVVLAPMLLLFGALARGGRRAAAVLLFLLVLATAFHTLERIVWVTLFAQGTLALLLFRACGLSSLSWGKLLAAIAVCAALVGAVFLAVQGERFRGEDPGTLSRDVRLGQWPEVARQIADHPLVGGGFGRGILSRVRPDLIPKETSQLSHAHNVFLNYGLGTGLPGVLALAWVFLALVREYWRLCREREERLKLLGVAGIVLVAGVVLRNQVNDMFIRDQSILFWSLNGMLLGLGRRVRSGAP
jgi:putative inorganic carbon (HCO3(-)) transporter